MPPETQVQQSARGHSYEILSTPRYPKEDRYSHRCSQLLLCDYTRPQCESLAVRTTFTEGDIPINSPRLLAKAPPEAPDVEEHRW